MTHLLKITPKVVTMNELKEAINAINTGKSEDIYGLSILIENIIYAGEEFLHHLLDLITNVITLLHNSQFQN